MIEERTTAYLLNELPETEAEQFEEQCFAQPEWPEVELDSAEADLIMAYVKNELSPERQRRFEDNYLTTEARKERLLLARSFLRVICPNNQTKPPWTRRLSGSLKSLAFAPQFSVPRFASVVLAFVLIATVLWFVIPPRQPQTFAQLSLVISADTRGASSQPQKVSLPIEEDALRISLTLPEPREATYRVQWDDVNGPLETLEIEKRDANSASVVIPADKLKPGQYALILFRKNPDGTEARVPGSYFFIVE